LRGVVPDIIIPDRLENAKLREKDNPDALHWDEIPKANYTLWNPGYSYTPVIQTINADVDNNVDFKGIREQVALLDNYRNSETPLNIVKYKQMQNNIQEAAKKLDNYSKLPVDLKTETLAPDSLEIAGDTAKVTKQKIFL
jgi:carboxyl-terminal processing protease